MRKTIATAIVAIAVLAGGCGDQGAIEIIKRCGEEGSTTRPADPACTGRDGFPDRADGKGNGAFRPRGF